MSPVRSVPGVPRMGGAVMGVRLVVAALLVVSLAPPSWATSLSDYAVFGGTHVSIWDGSTVNGQVGSNHNVYAQYSTLNGPVVGGGGFASGGGNRILGDLRFNGAVYVENGENGVADDFSGHVDPSGYTALVLPSTKYPATLPDSSGSLGSESGSHVSDVTLSGVLGGLYRYDYITGTLNLHLDLSQGPIYVYVDGDVSLSDVSVWVSDGQPYVSYAQAVADQALRGLAQNVYFETAGSWYMSGGEWFGLIYAPNGDADIGPGSDITGAVWAGQSVSLESNSQVSAIPEPITALGLVLGGLAALVCRKRK